ncbi:MAG: FlgD immunoglobulin-like domain containing protein [Saprospiraceae bacterium]
MIASYPQWVKSPEYAGSSMERNTNAKYHLPIFTRKAPQMLKILPYISCLLMWISIESTGFAQFENPIYQEAPDMPYIPVNPQARKTSPAYQYQVSNFWMTQVNVDEWGNNIIGDAANEPSIAVDQTNPHRMAIGWRQFDTIASNFRQAGFGYTTNGGLSWTVPGVLEPGVFRSDPVLDSDVSGRFYYNSLTLDTKFRCDVFRSTGDGSWDAGYPAQGGDKQWMAIDKTDGAGMGSIYASWSSASSYCYPYNFTRSFDGGETFDTCSSIDPSIKLGTLNVGPDGELYVIGDNGKLAKSTNVHLATMEPNWEISQVNFGGYSIQKWDPSPNLAGLLGQPWIATDHSYGANHGNVYILHSIKPFDFPSDPADIYFTRSTNGGATWSIPQRINDDNSDKNWQWFGSMSVAPNGRIDASWFDTRDNPGTYLSSLYFSFSEDGGITWAPNTRLTEEFNPYLGWPMQEKIGDYFHMVSDDGGAHIAFAATFNGEQDIYYGYVDHQSTSIVQTDLRSGQLFQNAPNPFLTVTRIPYTLSHAGHVQFRISSLMGDVVYVLDQGVQDPGHYTVTWDRTNHDGTIVPQGLYLYELMVNGRQVESLKMVVMDEH